MLLQQHQMKASGAALGKYHKNSQFHGSYYGRIARLLRRWMDWMDDIGQDPRYPMTTKLFLVSAACMLAIDLLLFFTVIQRIKPRSFSELSRAMFVSSFLFWIGLWTIIFAWGWSWFYSYIFPEWIKNWVLVLGVIYALMGFFIWWISTNLPGNPSSIFCLLGGLEGIISHIWAIYDLHVIETVPVLTGVLPIPILLFAFTEKIFYWSLVLCFAVLLQKIWLSLIHPSPSSRNCEKAAQIRQNIYDRLENQFRRNRFL